MGREQAVSLMQSELMKEEDKVETPSAEDKVEVAAEDKVESPFVDDQPEAAAVAEDVDAAGVKDEVAVEAEGKPETDVAEDEAKVAAQNTKQRWYVVHAYSGFESYVKKVLESRIATSEHKDKFGSIMVPTEEVVEMREGNRRKSERKFFPGYVLVQMEMDSDTWHMVKQVPKVLGFIGGTSDKPAPITEAEADAILNRVEEGVDRPRPKVLFEVGEVVRVNDGPFNDFNGVVEEVNYEKSKMLVSVQIFGRSTPVELAFGQVEKG
jgi:transcriptional antiterminator NusG